MRKILDYSPDCCDPLANIPMRCACSCACLMSGIKSDYRKLCKRYVHMVTKRQRIWDLAQPRRPSSKLRESCACPFVSLRKVQIIQLEKQFGRTRTEQLSYPTPSRLMELKNHPSYNTFDVERKLSVNRLIRKSLLSLYSRLANSQPPTPGKPPRKWTKKEWAARMKRIRLLSMSRFEWEERARKAKIKPKKKPKVYRKIVKKKKLSRRLRKLAKPRKYEDDTIKDWHLTPEMRYYQPSKRMLYISKPRLVDVMLDENPYVIKKEALNYRPSKRIINLSQPAHYAKKNAEEKSNAFLISKNALKGKVPPRVKQLAEPKDYVDHHTRADPYKVSARALKAKLTKRLEELARPKKYDF